MKLSRHFNTLMASALSFSLAATPMTGVGVAHAQNAPAAEAPGDSGWQKEFEAWRTASKAGSAADYQAYLKSYPAGKFASVARKRIDELNGPKTADAVKIDTQQTADTAQADTTLANAGAVRSADDEAEKTRDLEMWRQVSKTGKQADYEKYLKAFPKGKFAKVAKTRLDALVAAAETPADQQVAQSDQTPVQPDEQSQTQADDSAQVTEQVTEQPAQNDQAASQDDAEQNNQAQAQAPASDWEQEYALWKAASDGNTVNEYEAYLKTYPNGKFAAIAQARIVQLAAAEQPVANVDEGDTARSEQNGKVDPNQMTDQGHMNQDQQPDDQNQMASNQMDDPSQQNDTMGQNTQNQQKIQYSEGTPYTEDQFLNREGRHEMQGRLSSLGYDTFGSDGAFGPNTRTAISNWQQDNGAPVSGYLSGDQISQIRRLSQVSYAQWLEAHPIVVRRPVIVERVRPRRERVVVEERNPGLDAAIAVGVLGAVLGAQRFGRGGKFGCRKRRHC